MECLAQLVIDQRANLSPEQDTHTNTQGCWTFSQTCCAHRIALSKQRLYYAPGCRLKFVCFSFSMHSKHWKCSSIKSYTFTLEESEKLLQTVKSSSVCDISDPSPHGLVLPHSPLIFRRLHRSFSPPAFHFLSTPEITEYCSRASTSYMQTIAMY